MKTILKYFGVTLLSFLLLGCSSELDKQANNYASLAFETLMEQAETNITVDSVKWICLVIEYVDGEDIYSCAYYIEYKYERSNVPRFAEVAIIESTSFDGIDDSMYTFSTRKTMESDYELNLSYAKEASKNGKFRGSNSKSFDFFEYNNGSLSRREISDALKAAK